LGKTKIYDYYENGVLVSSHLPKEGQSLWRKALGDTPPNIKKAPHFSEFILADALKACGISENPTREETYTLLTHARLHPPPHFPFKKWKNFNLEGLSPRR
jgi:hypothetical protein